MDILLGKVLPAILPVFVIIALGYYIGRKHDYDLKFPTDVTMYLTLPCLIFSSLAHKWNTPFLAKEFVMTGSGAVFIICGTWLLVGVYLTLSGQRDLKVFYPTIMFINAGNLALSLDYFAFGYDGFLRGILFQMVNTSLMYTLGVYLVGRETSVKKIFQIPFFYAALAGILVWVLHIKLPDIVLHSVDFLGKAALPMLVLMLGYSLKNIETSNLSLALTGGALRIFGGLGMATAFVVALRLTGLVGSSPEELLTLKILIFNGSMPAALGTFLLAQKYNQHPELVAPTVFVSTLMGLTTIPVILWGVSTML